MARTDPSQRLEAMPPYMFAELERRVADKRKAGIDVISLGIGDPDQPTFPYIVEAMQAAVAEPGNHELPLEPWPRGVPLGAGRLLHADGSGSRSIPRPR